MDKVSANECVVCGSQDVCKLNTYKHYCYVCNDCNSVSHEKKKRYLLSYVLPSSVLKVLLPRKAYLRLFGDDNDSAASFYDVYADECQVISDWRKSEFEQILDEMKLAGVGHEGKSVLDVSGGPGYVGYQLQESGCRVVVTEFSLKSAQAISEKFGLETSVFDYTNDILSEKVEGRFDLIMLRSSVIFCPNLDKLIEDLRKLMNPGGHILLETIVPSLGEIFWWQQLEYKFPVIYSQEFIEKVFYKHGFSLLSGFRDYGSYFGVKNRSYKSKMKQLFTWVVEYPMIMMYRALNVFKAPAIDSSMRHKMLTQVWAFHGDREASSTTVRYNNFYQGKENKSKTFGFPYNGYLSLSNREKRK